MNDFELEQVMLSPPARRVDAATGVELPALSYDVYRIDRYGRDSSLSLPRTGHGLPFSDSLIQRRIKASNGVTLLVLKAQLYLSGNIARFEPIAANSN